MHLAPHSCADVHWKVRYTTTARSCFVCLWWSGALFFFFLTASRCEGQANQTPPMFQKQIQRSTVVNSDVSVTNSKVVRCPCAGNVTLTSARTCKSMSCCQAARPIFQRIGTVDVAPSTMRFKVVASPERKYPAFPQIVFELSSCWPE